MDTKIKKNISKILIITLCSLLCGCASVEYEKQTQNLAPRNVEGIFHIVKKGETIWQISQRYQTDVDSLVSANNINDSTKIEIGQKIFIPQAKKFEISAYSNVNSVFIWPLNAEVISGFGNIQNGSANKGILLRSFSEENVVAAKSGKITLIYPNLKSYGKTIIINHEDNFYTVYTNLGQILVSPEERVNQGMVIAKANSLGTGKGWFLNFEIRKNNKALNPLYYLPVR
jgi:murein DD-endopeptidase MepM/ murein hydrolase activator NlpD